MTNAFQATAAGIDPVPRDPAQRAARSLFQATRSAQLVILCVFLAAALPGCGNSSKPKAPAEQQPAAANAEEKAEAPAEEPRAKLGKKAAEAEKPAPALAPVARHRPDDPTKWELADLKSGLAARDMRFVLAVVLFGMQNQGAKRARELTDLLDRAGQMKDDSSITLPFPPVPTATPVTAAKPPAPTAPVTPPSGPNSGRRPPRLGRARSTGS